MLQVVLNSEIEDKRWADAIKNVADVAEKVKEAAFEYVAKNADIDILTADKPLIVNLCLSDDSHVRQLNRDYRNKDKPTNVLTFANLDFADFAPDGGVFDEIDLGNIIIAFDTMQKEADAENITLYAHFCHLLVHGFLHILGFDHIEDDEAEYMESFEKAILHNLGIANPYENEE